MSLIIETKEITSDDVSLPSSRKMYVETNGNTINQNKHNLRVPFREIALSPSRNMRDEIEENAPVRIYDTSGVWTDPNERCDVREGLPALRRDWIVGRGDVEEYEGRTILPQDNGYLTKGAEEIAKIKDNGKLRIPRPTISTYQPPSFCFRALSQLARSRFSSPQPVSNHYSLSCVRQSSVERTV